MIVGITNEVCTDKKKNTKDKMTNIEKVIDEVDIILKKNGLGIDEYMLDNEGNMFLTIIPLILRKPQRKRYSMTWVQDVPSFGTSKIISDFNTKHMNRPKDSRYVKGLPKNGDDEYAGIYFEDPVTLR